MRHSTTQANPGPGVARVASACYTVRLAETLGSPPGRTPSLSGDWVMGIDRVDAYLEAHRGDFEEQLKALLRIPSISAQPAHDADTRRAAEFVRDDLRAIGLTTELIATKRHPIVYAERCDAPGRPTLLVY